MSLRLEHSIRGGGTLYLHNTEKRKPPTTVAVAAAGGGENSGGSEHGSVIANSFALVFSSLRSAQDIFKLMRVAPREEALLRQVQSLAPPIALYSTWVADPSQPLSADFMEETVRVMLQLVDLLVKGEMDFPAKEDWIKRANGMLPAAFSSLFSGDPNPSAQRLCRELKLLDAVFDAGAAPYVRCLSTAATGKSESKGKKEGGGKGGGGISKSNPWGEDLPRGTTPASMLGPKGLQKFVHVALQRMTHGDAESQAYFGKRRSHFDGRLWMEVKTGRRRRGGACLGK